MPAARKAAAGAGASIQAEVAQYASQIGLRPSSGAGFDDSDFAPEKATLKLSSQPAADVIVIPSVKKSKNKFKPDAKPGDNVNSSSAEGKDSAPAAVKERTWNAGVGERPGQKTSKPLLDGSQLWHEAAAQLPALDSSNAPPADGAIMETKTRVAEKLMEAEAAGCQKRLAKSNPADARWLQDVRSAGTMRDKVAANALLVQEDAVANIRALDELVQLASKAGGARNVAGNALDALKELFATVLLPDRPLVAFNERPFRAVKPSKEGDRRLLLWWTEECIKKRYAIFVTTLEAASLDNLDWIKEKALKAAYELLAAKPELESKLLTLLINKLGDPNRQVASKAGYLISCLLTQHPLMGMVLVREVESFLFRPGQKSRARYYAVVTLNQMVLSHTSKHGGSALAIKLIDIYFTLFRLVLDRKIGVAAERDSAAEASGSDKGAGKPAPSKHGKGAKKQGKGSYKGKKGTAAHKGTKRIKTDGVATAEEVDSRMLGALLTGVRRAYPYVGQGKLDDVIERHSAQLFRTVHLAPFSVATQALMLLYQVMTAQDAVSDRFFNALYQSLLHPEMSKSTALPQFLSIVFQAVKADVSAKRAAAFLKRMLQVALHQPSNAACASLLVASELLKAKAPLWPSLTQPEDSFAAEARDAPEDDAADMAALPPGADRSHAPAPSDSNLATSPAATGDTPQQEASGMRQASGNAAGWGVASWPPEDYYDMLKRTPQFARADRACCWEAALLATHAHPSVATFAQTLLAGTNIVYDGDPLKDLTLLAFLDKFVKRKPGKQEAQAAERGVSVMQPMAAPTAPASTAAAQSASFDALAAEQVAPEDVFFHKFMTLDSVRRRAAVNRAKRKGKKARKQSEDGEGVLPDDSSSEGSDGDDSDAEDAFMDAIETMDGDALGDPDLELDSADLDDDMPENISDDAKVKKAKSTKANDITRKADQQNKVKQRADEKAENNGVLAEAADERGVEAAMQHQNWQVTDEELEGANVFDLPAPSDSDTSFASIVSSDSDASDSDAKGNAAFNAAASTADTVKAAAKARGAAGESSAADLQGCLHDDNAASGSDADSDLDEAAFMAAAFGGGSDAGGSSEEEAGDDLAGSIDSDEEHLVDTEASTSDGDSDIDEPSDDNPPGPWGRERTVAEAGTAKRGKKSKPKSIFAAAEDYAEQIAELQKQSAGTDSKRGSNSSKSTGQKGSKRTASNGPNDDTARPAKQHKSAKRGHVGKSRQ